MYFQKTHYPLIWWADPASMNDTILKVGTVWVIFLSGLKWHDDKYGVVCQCCQILTIKLITSINKLFIHEYVTL